MGLSIAGTAYDAHLDRATLLHVNALSAEPDTLTFDLIPGATKPVEGSEVIYTLPDTSRLFGGVLTDVEEVRVGHKAVSYRCTCSDWRARANRRRPNKLYVNQKAGAIVVSLFALYAPEFDTSSVDTTGGPTIPAIRFNRSERLTDCLDRLAGITGYVWDITPEKAVTWETPGTTPAPISLTDTSRNFRDLTVNINRDELANYIVVRGGFYANPTSTIEKFDGNGVRTLFPLAKRPFDTTTYEVFSESFGSLSASTWTATDVSNPSPPAGHVSGDGYLFTTIQSGASLVESGLLQVVGGNGTWGDVRLESVEVYERGDGYRRFEMDWFPGDVSGQGRCGLWDPNQLGTLAGEVYGLFWDAGTLKPSEGGVAQTALATVTYTDSDQIRTRIIPGETQGANYWYSTDAANGFPPSSWNLLYTTTNGTTENLTIVPIFNKDITARVDRVKVFNRLPGVESVTVDGVAQVFGLLGVDEDSGVDCLVGMTEGETPVLAFFPDNIPASGTNNIVITYTDALRVLVQAQDQDSIDTLAALEGTDGIYEAYIEDETLNSRDLARQRATQELEQYANPVTTIGFSTRESGLRSGQVLTASLTSALSGRDLDNTFLIRQVNTRSLGSGEYEHSVSAGSRLKGLNEYLLDLLKRGRRLDDAGDIGGLVEELAYQSDRFGFTDEATITEGALPPYRYAADLWVDATTRLVTEDGGFFDISTGTPAKYGRSTYQ